MALHTLLFAILSAYRTIALANKYLEDGDSRSDCFMVIGMYKMVTLYTAYNEGWLEFLINEAPVYVIEHLLKQRRLLESVAVCLLLLFDWRHLSLKMKVAIMAVFVYDVPNYICRVWRGTDG